MPDRVWFYCRHTGSLVIDSLLGINGSLDVEDVDEMLVPYEERVHDDETSYSYFLCRIAEVDFEKQMITLKDEPYNLEGADRRVRWSGSFDEFNALHSQVKKIWGGMFSG